MTARNLSVVLVKVNLWADWSLAMHVDDLLLFHGYSSQKTYQETRPPDVLMWISEY